MACGISTLVFGASNVSQDRSSPLRSAHLFCIYYGGCFSFHPLTFYFDNFLWMTWMTLLTRFYGSAMDYLHEDYVAYLMTCITTKRLSSNAFLHGYVNICTTKGTPNATEVL